MNEEEENKIDEEFNQLVENTTDDEFWEYTRSWFSVETILDIMKNWSIETKKEAIEELKKIMVRCPKCKSDDVYESDLHPLFNHRCNSCGEYFKWKNKNEKK